MSRIGLLLVTAATALLVWFNSSELQVVARLWTTALLALLPPLMIVQAELLRDVELLPRRAAYVSSIGSLWLLAAATLLVSWATGFTAADIGLRAMSPVLIALWTVGLTLAGVAVLFAFRLAGFREAPLLRQLLPVGPAER